jgi:hypothetical protein
MTDTVGVMMVIRAEMSEFSHSPSVTAWFTGRLCPSSGFYTESLQKLKQLVIMFIRWCFLTIQKQQAIHVEPSSM